MMEGGVLVLDFDGVICDSWRECALVTWAAQHGWAPERFGVTAWKALPATFVERFRALRGYARHLGHFLVPVLVDSAQVTSQDDFDRYYTSLPPEAVAEFIRRASAYRVAARTRRRTHWLAMHDLYPGLASLLSRKLPHLYIVTARDSDSVRKLLSQHGITVKSERIYGEQHSKNAALADIQVRERAELFFVDDSIDNVIAAQADGHHVAWALWGYSAPEHHTKATRLRVPMLSLHDLPALGGYSQTAKK
jgi:phosphoglycolate phosphatase-like HAD superfamily hydrolase